MALTWILSSPCRQDSSIKGYVTPIYQILSTGGARAGLSPSPGAPSLLEHQFQTHLQLSHGDTGRGDLTKGARAWNGLSGNHRIGGQGQARIAEIRMIAALNASNRNCKN